jgi:hypothetical protein
MTDTECSIQLDGGSFKLDQKIPKELAARIAILVISDGKTDLAGDGTGPTGHLGDNAPHSARKPGGFGKASSLREYLDQHEAKKISHEIVCIGSYYQIKNNHNFFTRAELDSGFEEASSQAPANLPRDIKATIGLGWISPKSGGKDPFYVTNTGSSAIDANFKTAKGGSTGRKPRKRAKKKQAK